MCEKCACHIFSMDSKTPFRVHLSAYYKRSFAFHTVKERMPVILTQLIDSLVRDKEEIVEKYGEDARVELKTVIGGLSKLKYEIQTNKPIEKLVSTAPDAEVYNRYLLERTESEGQPRYFTTIWLHAECYMYRHIWNLLENTTFLTKFDPFRKKKEDSFNKSIDAIIAVAENFLPIVQKPEEQDAKSEFMRVVKLCLWGNKCDLSISAGSDNSQKVNPLKYLKAYDNRILCDHSEEIWKTLNSSEPGHIEFICDNAGYELFTDFCLADFLMTNKLAKSICFNLKAIPWFISDTMHEDFRWIIRRLINHEDEFLKKLGIRWNKYIREGFYTHTMDDFWTYPLDFTHMKSISPDLYAKLSESSMIIFKGDLNYRKLFGEMNWEPSTPVSEALQGFKPTKLCTLRTVKADIICGLPKGVAEELDRKEPKWMTTGDYGVIQYSG